MRELVGIGHRYVRSLMIALVRGTGDTAKELLRDSFKAVPEVSTREQQELLKQLEGLIAVAPSVLTVKSSTFVENEETLQERDLLRAIDLQDLFLDDVSFEDEEQVDDPVRRELSKYLDRVVKTLRAPLYTEKFYLRTVNVKGNSYVLVVTGSLKNTPEFNSTGPYVEYNICGTAGNAKSIDEMDDKYFYSPGDGPKLSAQRELDKVGPFGHIVLWGWALHLVEGREIRFWINRRGGKDVAKIRIRMDPKCPGGFKVTKTYKAAPEVRASN